MKKRCLAVVVSVFIFAMVIRPCGAQSVEVQDNKSALVEEFKAIQQQIATLKQQINVRTDRLVEIRGILKFLAQQIEKEEAEKVTTEEIEEEVVVKE